MAKTTILPKPTFDSNPFGWKTHDEAREWQEKLEKEAAEVGAVVKQHLAKGKWRVEESITDLTYNVSFTFQFNGTKESVCSEIDRQLWNENVVFKNTFMDDTMAIAAKVLTQRVLDARKENRKVSLEAGKPGTYSAHRIKKDPPMYLDSIRSGDLKVPTTLKIEELLPGFHPEEEIQQAIREFSIRDDTHSRSRWEGLFGGKRTPPSF